MKLRLMLIAVAVIATVAIVGLLSDVYTDWQVKKTTELALRSVQAGSTEKALGYFYLNEPTKKANDLDRIIKLYAKQLNDEKWSIKAAIRQGNDAWVIIYINPEPGSATGTIKYVYLHRFEEGWKILPDENSLFSGIKWISG